MAERAPRRVAVLGVLLACFPALTVFAKAREGHPPKPTAATPLPPPLPPFPQPCRLKPFGVRITALRRKPWGSHTRHAEQQDAGQALCRPFPGCQPDPGLEAAAEAALADRGCWGQDSARLAAEADIIAGMLARVVAAGGWMERGGSGRHGHASP